MKRILEVVVKFVELNRRACRVLDQLLPNFFGVTRHYDLDQHEIIFGYIQNPAYRNILEVGGVDRPILSKSRNYKYVGLDIDNRPGCDACYDEFLVQSIEDPVEYDTAFDLIISTTLLEHVPNNTDSFKSMFNALASGGIMVHYVPSKYHFYSICLRLVGPKLQKLLIKYLRPDAMNVSGYPAFFDKCSPKEMYQLCTSTGFNSVRIIPYFRATDYFAFFIPFYIIVALFENIFERLNVSFFASGFVLVAMRPSNEN